MDSQSDRLPKTLTARHKCSACYKQYKKKEHLIDHMRVSYHSVHQPKCGACRKHCKSFESVREHLTGPLPKVDCAKIYNAQGCDLCLNVFDSMEARDAHKKLCCMSPPVHPGSDDYNDKPIFWDMYIYDGPSDELPGSDKEKTYNFFTQEFMNMPLVQIGAISEVDISGLSLNDDDQRPDVVALDCEMVGGGSDGSLNLCGRVCIIDEDENVIFHAYVQPQIPITNYRSEITGMTEDQFNYALSLKQVKEKIQEILYNGESIWKLRMEGGKARILVGHDLEHDLGCLLMHYPDHLMRDTAKYRPLMKTNLISHSLKYLARTYLGYDIQTGVHDPYDDCVAAMRLYKRMRDQVHPPEVILTSMVSHHSNIFDGWKAKELEKMSPDELLEISRSDYRCWCLDSRKSLTS